MDEQRVAQWKCDYSSLQWVNTDVAPSGFTAAVLIKADIPPQGSNEYANINQTAQLHKVASAFFIGSAIKTEAKYMKRAAFN